MDPRCRASLRALSWLPGIRVQSVIAARRRTTAYTLVPPSPFFAFPIYRAARFDTARGRIGHSSARNLVRPRLCCGVASSPRARELPPRSTYMQIPIARRIDYPRPDRDRARSRDARARCCSQTNEQIRREYTDNFGTVAFQHVSPPLARIRVYSLVLFFVSKRTHTDTCRVTQLFCRTRHFDGESLHFSSEILPQEM